MILSEELYCETECELIYALQNKCSNYTMLYFFVFNTYNYTNTSTKMDELEVKTKLVQRMEKLTIPKHFLKVHFALDWGCDSIRIMLLPKKIELFPLLIVQITNSVLDIKIFETH